MSKNKIDERNEERPLNERQLAYCDNRAKGMTMGQAYAKAFENTDDPSKQPKYPSQYGSDLEADERVKAKIAEYKAEYAEAANITVESQIGRWNQMYLMCQQAGKYKDAMEALKNMEELCGFRDEIYKSQRAEISIRNGVAVQKAPETLKGLVVDESTAVIEIDEETGEPLPPEEGSTQHVSNEILAIMSILNKTE